MESKKENEPIQNKNPNFQELISKLNANVKNTENQKRQSVTVNNVNSMIEKINNNITMSEKNSNAFIKKTENKKRQSVAIGNVNSMIEKINNNINMSEKNSNTLNRKSKKMNKIHKELTRQFEKIHAKKEDHIYSTNVKQDISVVNRIAQINQNVKNSKPPPLDNNINNNTNEVPKKKNKGILSFLGKFTHKSFSTTTEAEQKTNDKKIFKIDEKCEGKSDFSENTIKIEEKIKNEIIEKKLESEKNKKNEQQEKNKKLEKEEKHDKEAKKEKIEKMLNK